MSDLRVLLLELSRVQLARPVPVLPRYWYRRRVGPSVQPQAMPTVDNSDDGPGNCTVAGQCTLRAAVTYANTNPNSTITFSNSVNWASNPIVLSAGELPYSGSTSLTIDASSISSGVTVNANSANRIFEVTTSGVSLTMNNMTLENGVVPVANFGGAILMDLNTGNFIGTNMVFAGNSTPESGGAIFVTSGAVTCTGCTFTGNSAGTDGSAILANTLVTVTNSTFTGNTGGVGPYVIASGGTIVSTNSVFSGNSGGGLHATTGATVNGSSISGGGDVAVLATGGLISATNSSFLNNAGGGLDGLGAWISVWWVARWQTTRGASAE